MSDQIVWRGVRVSGPRHRANRRRARKPYAPTHREPQCTMERISDAKRYWATFDKYKGASWR